MRVSVTILLVFGLTRMVQAQSSPERAFETLLENLFTQQDEDVAYEEQYEILYQLYTQPINLNQADEEGLQELFFLSSRQISNLLHYRQRYGDLRTVYELQFIPAFNHDLIQQMLPFITVNAVPTDTLSWAERWQRADKLLILRQATTLETKRGFIPQDTLTDPSLSAPFIGSKPQLYTRLRVSRRNDFSLGLTLEKDAGEAIRWQPTQSQYGSDFQSYHLQIQNRGVLENLLIGDYSLQFGQGLLLGQGFNLGKSAFAVTSVGRTRSQLRPYTSSTESGFFRGATATLQQDVGKMQLELTPFVSNQWLDAKLHNRADSSLYFRSLQTSGWHRTESERNSQDQAREQVIGGNVLLKNRRRNGQIGVSYVRTAFDYRWQRSDELRNFHEFSGKVNEAWGVFGNYRYRHYHFFGEAARSASGGWGAVGGLSASLSSTVEMAWVLRHYSPDFHSFYGNALSEGSRPINEQGFYWGLRMEPFKKATLSAYYDYFRFPWLRFRVDAPSTGHELLARFDYQLTRWTSLFAQFREEEKAINVDLDSLSVRVPLPGNKRQLALGITHTPVEGLRLNTRWQQTAYRLNQATDRGWVIAQDVTYQRGRWKTDLRFALFDAEEYDTRQYLYEHDLLYTFSIPAYSGQGSRTYWVLRYKLNRHLSFWTKIGRTVYADRNVIGSSVDAIDGNTRTDIRAQVIVKF
ncbi:ComEA family DNA-binding protein [Tunicatimonas pelagia]|uniref:ComEA family DNA-binding protein n=1 Tax=Tunicatimonas pelagia TaxID=931531 RepID=UPI0026662FB2|nr:helix-hairpin-helix domain-containing protein [Tunicatimonas pelagia]WKN41652.1 helix-hairpin-helix domain-containing protein [Tunicatimonas pelagia]